MPPSFTAHLDPSNRATVHLWHAAATELWIGPEGDDPQVQAAFHAVLEWLRGEAVSPHGLLRTFVHPHGPLGPQLQFVGSLLHGPEQLPADEPPRLWWWVVKAAYYRRWQELTDPRWTTGQPSLWPRGA